MTAKRTCQWCEQDPGAEYLEVTYAEYLGVTRGESAGIYCSTCCLLNQLLADRTDERTFSRVQELINLPQKEVMATDQPVDEPHIVGQPLAKVVDQDSGSFAFLNDLTVEAIQEHGLRPNFRALIVACHQMAQMAADNLDEDNEERVQQVERWEDDAKLLESIEAKLHNK